MKKLELMVALVFLAFFQLYGHQDFYVYGEYKNVKTRIKTGFEYEEINKIEIIGKSVQKLAELEGYKKNIFLDFAHNYIEDCESDYFLSFDKGSITQSWGENKKEPNLLSFNGIVLRQVGRFFDVDETLKLIEFAIQNVGEIKKNQRKIRYEQNFCQWIINTIDTIQLKKVVENDKSQKLNSILMEEIKLDKNQFENGINYYYKNGQYHFSEKTEPPKAILSISNVFQTFEIDENQKMIFDTDTSFYFLRIDEKLVLSERFILSNSKGHYEPFRVKKKSKDLITINFWRYGSEIERQREEWIVKKSFVLDLINIELDDYDPEKK
ncbi:MAG: hypothetical protein DWQ02_17350 [Bacteroidetes bacterium]|nr:MAG: hypothetical protein DWQ02_17350 [Bacteroidota bacterium]